VTTQGELVILDINSDAGYDLDGCSDAETGIIVIGPDQIAKLKKNRVLGSASDPSTSDRFYLLSWTCTTPVDPISSEAADACNPLANWAYSQFTPYSYPNVLLLGFCRRALGPGPGGRQREGHGRPDHLGCCILGHGRQ
jgi:hypothetical protein